MEKRVPTSACIHEALRDLIEGHVISADGRMELITLSEQLVFEEALEAENRDESNWE
jgi:hypothetical protein